MDAALQRCYRAVPLAHVRDLAPSRGVLALRCTKSGCISCADFATDGRIAFEERLRARHPDFVAIRPWNCDVTEMRDLALAAGVSQLPAYVLVRASGEVAVRHVV